MMFQVSSLQRFFSYKTRKSGEQLIHTYVHPCVINQQPHIVYPRGLQHHSPQLFEQLNQYFSRRGYQLKEDQRSQTDSAEQLSRRRKWAPILLFSAALMFESNASADVEIELDTAESLNEQTIELNLLPSHTVRGEIRQALNVDPHLSSIDLPKLKQRTAEVLFDVLSSRYQQQPNDPSHIVDDLKTIAEYYSDFPEVLSLFGAIRDANWTLVFDEDNWTTIASGNMLSIQKAEVHFNPRSAAQLRLNDSCKDNPVCIASPADALLHELLHVHSMFNDTENFLAQGGMNGVLYPYQHERQIIKQERELYRKMSVTDNIDRPYRHSHHGRIVKAHCATCIK